MFVFFFFNDTATTEIYTLSLHDALPIWGRATSRSCRTTAVWTAPGSAFSSRTTGSGASSRRTWARTRSRSEEHTSELQSLAYLVCRLLLEKKNTTHSIFCPPCTHTFHPS